MSNPSESFSGTQSTSPSSEATITPSATASSDNAAPSTGTVSNKGSNGFNTMTIAVPLGMALALLMGGIAFYLHRKQRKRRARRWHGAGGGSNYAQMREDASLVSLPASSLNLRLFGPDGWLGRFGAARQRQQQHQQQQQPALPIVHSPVTRPDASRANPFIAGGFTFGEGAAGVADGLGRRPSVATSYQASEFIRHSSHAPSEADHSFTVHTHHTGASSTYPSVSAHHTGSSFQSHNAPRITPYPYPHPLRMQHTGSTKVGSDLQSVTMRDSADGHGAKEDDNLERGKMKDPFGDDASLGGTTDTDSYSSHASWSTAGRESRR